MSTNHPAGSATGFDLSREQFESAVRRLTHANDESFKRDEDRPDDYADYVMGTYWSIWSAALARATPQHSVTEQDEPLGRRVTYVPSRGKKGVVQVTAWGPADMTIPPHRRIIEDLPMYARAQPLASTAATQPEQASERALFENEMQSQHEERLTREDLNALWSEFPGYGWRRARAALAIPASTAASEQQAGADERALFRQAVASMTDGGVLRENSAAGIWAWKMWQAALTHRATTAPGYKLVPIEPTPEMLESAVPRNVVGHPGWRIEYAAAYKSLVAAAPGIATTAADQRFAALDAANAQLRDARRQREERYARLWTAGSTAADQQGDTPRVDALMARWGDDGATRGSAFIELRDLARELESSAAQAQAGDALDAEIDRAAMAVRETNKQQDNSEGDHHD